MTVNREKISTSSVGFRFADEVGGDAQENKIDGLVSIRYQNIEILGL